MQAPQSRWSRTLGHLLLASASLAVALLAAEVAVRYLDGRAQARRAGRARPFYTWSTHTFAGHPVGSHRGPLKLMLHPLVGVVNLPDQRTEFFTINHQGFRGPETGPKEPGRHRIILVGGSAAFGTGLDSDDETLAAQLQRRLRDSEVVNAAVIGHRSGQELSFLASNLLDLEPDLVLTLDGWNDFWAIRQRPTPWPDVNGVWQTQEQLERLHSLTYAPLHVRLVHLPEVVLASTLRRLRVSPLPWIDRQVPTGPMPAHEVQKVAARYARNQVKMARIASAFGAGFLCVVQANGDLLHAAHPTRFARFRQEVEAELTRRRVPWLDLNERGDVLRPDMFMDPIHLDARGNAAMADILAPVLADVLRTSARTPGTS